ncbi:MAG: hypothetical protein Q8Q08_08205 [Candidatus Omnitrophota bacterium]|nr:hypothetical protein [Candidatus Omnitrophota bacterium]MDZ4242384.1 hypothetical protein [Candidatus Omnitrophota bacterium]
MTKPEPLPRGRSISGELLAVGAYFLFVGAAFFPDALAGKYSAGAASYAMIGPAITGGLFILSGAGILLRYSLSIPCGYAAVLLAALPMIGRALVMDYGLQRPGQALPAFQEIQDFFLAWGTDFLTQVLFPVYFLTRHKIKTLVNTPRKYQ